MIRSYKTFLESYVGYKPLTVNTTFKEYFEPILSADVDTHNDITQKYDTIKADLEAFFAECGLEICAIETTSGLDKYDVYVKVVFLYQDRKYFVVLGKNKPELKIYDVTGIDNLFQVEFHELDQEVIYTMADILKFVKSR